MASGLQTCELVGLDVERMDLAVDVRLADAAGDELCVLAAEVEDYEHYSSR
jgi:hypothetical protein